jgi:arylsulfatase A-like enzyme
MWTTEDGDPVGSRARGRRTAVVALSLAVAAAAAAGIGIVIDGGRDTAGGGVTRLPPRMQIEETVASLSARFDRSSVVEERTDSPVRTGRLRPGFELDVQGRHRRAIIAPPPARVRFRVDVPAGATLRFGIGADPGDGDAEAGAVRFAVAVDGAERFARVLHPAERKRERRWFDEEISLRASADRAVDIDLITRPVDAAAPVGGTAGFSAVRVVREVSRPRAAATAARPNVLFLMVDTLRADRLGCYGAEPTLSPTLDALAARGTLFEQAVAQSAWTLPSVASIFTGLHPRSHGVVGISDHVARTGSADTDAREPDASSLSEEIRTLAQRAQDAGITTVGVSANPLVSRATNLARGFETFVEFGYGGRARPWRRADEINAIFLGWLSLNGENRFFAYLHYMDVHGPYDPPPAYRPPRPAGVRPAVASGEVSTLARKVNAGRDVRLTPTEIAYLRALYDAQIRHWDDELRRLLDALAGAGLRERTVVVVAADHGETFLEHGRLKHGVQLYDELIRVPLIVRGPGVPAARVGEQAQGIDLLPTIGAILGLEASPAGPGQNLLAGPREAAAVSETRWGVAADGRTTELVSMRTRQWKLIHAPALGAFELYDLGADPLERVDRFGTTTAGAELVRALAGWRASAPPPPAPAGGDPGFRDKLRALGYAD